METKESQKQEWDDEDVIDVGEILYALLRKLWIIIGALVIGGAIGGAYSYFLLTPQYTSTAKIYVLTKETTLTSLADLQIGTQLTQDYKTIITGRSVMEEVVDKLHLDMDYKNLRVSDFALFLCASCYRIFIFGYRLPCRARRGRNIPSG